MADPKDPLVHYVSGVPKAIDFDYQGGTPICVDDTTGDIYIMLTGVAPYTTIKKVVAGAYGNIRGAVSMVFDSGAWRVVSPAGSSVSTTGTTTSGLQEAINYAQTNGYPLEVWGPGATAAGGQPALITCTTGLTLGPICQLGLFVRNGIINWGAGVSAVGLTVDSCDTMNVEIDALLQYAGSGDSVLLFKPTTNYPISAATNIQGSKFRIKEVLATGGTVSKLVRFDPTGSAGGSSKGISNTMFDLGYLLGGGFASYGIYIDNPTDAAHPFNNNQIKWGLIVSCPTASVQVGTGAIVQATQPLAANWFHGAIETTGTSTDGVKCYGFLNRFDVSIAIDSGTLTNGINFANATATDNLVLANQIVATNKVVDSGARNIVIHDGLIQMGAGSGSVGTPTNDNAAAGNIGEYISATTTSGSPVSMTTNTGVTLASVALTPGDWDVSVSAFFQGNNTTTVSWYETSISTTNNTVDETPGRDVVDLSGLATSPYAVVSQVAQQIGPVRISLNTNTTVYGVVKSAFATSTQTVYGVIRARRVR